MCAQSGAEASRLRIVPYRPSSVGVLLFHTSNRLGTFKRVEKVLKAFYIGKERYVRNSRGGAKDLEVPGVHHRSGYWVNGLLYLRSIPRPQKSRFD